MSESEAQAGGRSQAMADDGIVEAMLPSVMRQVSSTLLLLDAELRVCWRPSETLELLGGDRPCLLGASFSEYLHPETDNWDPEYFVSLIQQGRRMTENALLLRAPRSGERDARTKIWASVSLTPLEGCEPLAFAVQLSDVTDEVLRSYEAQDFRELQETRSRMLGMLAQPLTLNERLDDILRYVSSLSEVTGGTRKGVFVTRDSSQPCLVSRASVGISTSLLERLKGLARLTLPLEERPAEPREVQCLYEVPELSEPLGMLSQSPEVYGLVSVPCFSGEELMGILYLFSVPGTLIDLSTSEMLWSLGESCGLAIAKDLVREEWQHAQAASESQSQLKAQFLANVTHELRTPLNGILGVASLLETTDLDEEQRELVTTFARSGRSLLTIVDQILDLGRFEAKGVTLVYEPFTVAKLLEEAVDILQPEAQGKGLFLDWSLDPRWSERSFLGDEERLRQVLINLLGNAVKFTEEGEVSVYVHARPVIGTREVLLEFCIEDTGPGIPPEKLGEVFESFVQLDGSSTRKAGGTGLGLAISKSIVEEMGGKIWVESEQGEGSRFSFALQLSLAD